ncbi:MAG: aldolase/citrate lyase family protein [Gemmatimonadales bacterium]|nr:aldolase/citrate lyase family protein [Gemmatimonadales bacterium]
MSTPAFADALRARRPLLGCIVTQPVPDFAELYAAAGWDWLLLDLEHGLLDLADCQRLDQAAPALASVVRVPSLEGNWLARALDTGVAGVMVPRMQDAAQAAAAVRQAKYPPLGERGVGLARATRWGAAIPGVVTEANRATALLLQIEDATGVAHADAIARTPGVDALFLGPFDLSTSLGVPGQLDAPVVREAVARVRTAAEAAGLPLGILAPTAAGARQAIAEGYTPLLVGADLPMLAGAARALREAIGDA